MTSKGEPADDELDLVAIYEPRNFASTAPALRRASYTAWYGGGTLDLRGATLDPAGALLTVRRSSAASGSSYPRRGASSSPSQGSSAGR